MKKHQNERALSTIHIYFAFAWSRNMFPAVKILISILGLLFECSCLFCCRISHPQLPWAPHSRLLQFQLIWTELGWSMTSPNISVSSSFWGWWHRERGAQGISLPVSELQLFWILAMPWEGKPQRECTGLLGAARLGPGDGAGTLPHLSPWVALTHPLPRGTGSLTHYRDWKEKIKKS